MTQIRFKIGEQPEGERVGPVKHGPFALEELPSEDIRATNRALNGVQVDFLQVAKQILMKSWELKTPEDFALEVVGFMKGSMNGPEALASAWKLLSTALVKPGIVFEAARFLLDANAEPDSDSPVNFPNTGARGVSVSTPVERYHIRSTFASDSIEGRVFERARRDFFGAEDAL